MRALLVSPDDDARRGLHVMLARHVEVVATSELAAAQRWLAANSCDVVLGASELLQQLAPVCARIALVARRDAALLGDGIDYVLAEPVDELAIALALRHVGALARREPPAVAGAPVELVGDGAAMQQLRATIQQVAATRSTVLVLGESGTGKDLVARMIHDASPRRARRFVAVNCAAIPAALLETELFGHVKGAFTDAVRDRAGLFEDADGGTLFLDEIGELPLALQAKLLRVLQAGEIRRVGDGEPLQVDVRVIAATLRDLAGDVASGAFREDLYYRLHVVPVHVPALRDRPDDIPQLARFFAARHAARHGRAVELAPDALDALRARAWPGNVRELENVVERAVVLADEPVVDAALLAGMSSRNGSPADANLDALSIKKATRRLEEELITRALGVTQGNRTNAAKLLEISHRALLYKMKEYGIS
nr:sigma 54-interacting transcriptional regulator [Kofleriaceae bacterium]